MFNHKQWHFVSYVATILWQGFLEVLRPLYAATCAAVLPMALVHAASPSIEMWDIGGTNNDEHLCCEDKIDFFSILNYLFPLTN